MRNVFNIFCIMNESFVNNYSCTKIHPKENELTKALKQNCVSQNIPVMKNAMKPQAWLYDKK